MALGIKPSPDPFSCVSRLFFRTNESRRLIETNFNPYYFGLLYSLVGLLEGLAKLYFLADLVAQATDGGDARAVLAHFLSQGHDVDIDISFSDRSILLLKSF